MRRLLAVLAALAGVLAAPAAAPAQQVVRDLVFTASDGVRLHASVSGAAPLKPRPLIVEYSPYGQGPGGPPAGPGFNYVQVHARGTGRSNGTWDLMGPREQRDIAESLRWLCDQPWSAGSIGLYGFSASAIAAYYAMRRTDLPCVKTAGLLAGTSSTYRDLVYLGGMPNMAPAAVVMTAIGGAFLAALPQRFRDQPQTAVQSGLETGLAQLTTVLPYLDHETEDEFWQSRTFPGPDGVPDLPILVATGFYDVESRGPFQTFQALKGTGSHLLVIGAHDGPAGGTGGVHPQFRRWFERHLLGADNGIDREPTVQLYAGHGGHFPLLDGKWTKIEAPDWPVPGTAWRTLHLDAARSGSATSVNDGTLALRGAAQPTTQTAPALPSLTTQTDPYTTATITSAGARPLFDTLPALGQMALTDATSLTYTTAPLRSSVLSVGPAALKVRLKSTSPETDLVAVLSDVAPDGAATPVAAGRLRSTFTNVDAARSLKDPLTGEIVQPFNDFSAKQAVGPGQEREYQVEFWPIGNRFAPGHRIRLTLAGTPVSFLPTIPALNSIVVGGAQGARLQFPVLPGSDLCAALGAPSCAPAAARGKSCARSRKARVRVQQRSRKVLRISTCARRR